MPHRARNNQAPSPRCPGHPTNISAVLQLHSLCPGCLLVSIRFALVASSKSTATQLSSRSSLALHAATSPLDLPFMVHAFSSTLRGAAARCCWAQEYTGAVGLTSDVGGEQVAAAWVHAVRVACAGGRFSAGKELGMILSKAGPPPCHSSCGAYRGQLPAAATAVHA
jgi:hypothetical protein